MRDANAWSCTHTHGVLFIGNEAVETIRNYSFVCVEKNIRRKSNRVY